MKQYSVTGMSCAACSARVEKAVRALPGVRACSVNLLTHSMGVEGPATVEEIVQAVTAAGYGAAPKEGDAPVPSPAAEVDESRPLRHRLVASLIFLAALMYSHMGHMVGLPLPVFLAGNPLANGLCQ
ncbi:MAG: cation-translocating P-type ATPase, partial [Clostridia bacterium]|nr:cation-translocating P-type ATPase [Clostridia bacterium]